MVRKVVPLHKEKFLVEYFSDSDASPKAVIYQAKYRKSPTVLVEIVALVTIDYKKSGPVLYRSIVHK